MIKQEFRGASGILLPGAITIPKGEEIAISQDWLIFPEAIIGEGKVWTIDGLLEPCIKPDNEVWVDSNIENPFMEPIIYKGKNEYGWYVGEIPEDTTNELDYIDWINIKNIVVSKTIPTEELLTPKLPYEYYYKIGLGIVSESCTYSVLEFTTPVYKIPYTQVDLGLPSGLKWADRNVGAETPQDNGLYFSWGNVDGHAVDENGNTTDGYSFDSDTYETPLGGQYTGSTLDTEHDAATVNMGSEWRMPTNAETLELVQNTKHYYIGEDGSIVAGPFDYETSSSDKGLDGSKLRSICFVKKDATFNYNDRSNFIEFPFAGYCSGSLLGFEGLYGYVWSSSVYVGNVEYAHVLFFNSFGYLYGGDRGSSNCYAGQSVRGVRNN